MSKSEISEITGRTASIIDAITTGISIAGGDPDVEIVRIIQPELSQKIGRLIMENLFTFVEERNYEIDHKMDLATLLSRLQWSPDMKATFSEEEKKAELYELLDPNSPEWDTVTPRLTSYRTVALTRRMTP